MKTELNAKEWQRLRAYCGEFTQREIERKHQGRLARTLYDISQGRVLQTRYAGGGAGKLSTAQITEALRYCKQIAGPTGPGKLEEIQE